MSARASWLMVVRVEVVVGVGVVVGCGTVLRVTTSVERVLSFSACSWMMVIVFLGSSSVRFILVVMVIHRSFRSSTQTGTLGGTGGGGEVVFTRRRLDGDRPLSRGVVVGGGCWKMGVSLRRSCCFVLKAAKAFAVSSAIMSLMDVSCSRRAAPEVASVVTSASCEAASSSVLRGGGAALLAFPFPLVLLPLKGIVEEDLATVGREGGGGCG